MTDIDMNGSSAPAVSEFGVHSESPPSHDREDGHITLEELGELINDAASTGFPNNNGSKCRYTEVRVLLISWADESSFDMHVREEILGLGLVLAERYNFSVEKYQIPHGTRSHSALAMKVLQLAHYDGEDVDRKGVDGWGRENILKIVYYGGHGYLANNRDLCWCNRTKESGPYYSVVQWSGIQSTLVASESDVLIILGCCSSGVASPSLGNGSSELIATCGFHEEANGTGPKSFTKALIHELYAMSGMTSFTAAELYTRILSRLHGHISDCEDHEQMKAPIHVMLNHRTTSIHGPAIRLSAMRPSSPPTELVHIPASKSADGAWDSTNNTPGAPSPASLPSSVSSVSMQEGKSSTFLLSVKLKEDHNLESLTGAVADWIKAVPVSAESIKFEAAYRIFSTLIIIFMPGAMWCYFKRHPAITCLGIVTPGPIITRNELNIAVKEKLALEQGEKRKQRQNPDADCYKQSYVDAFLLGRVLCPELDCFKQSPLPSVENSLLSETESKGLPKLGGEAYNASSTLRIIKVPGRSDSTFENSPLASAGSCRESYFPFHDDPVATPYVSLQPSYNRISEQDSGKLGEPMVKRRQRQSSQGHTRYSST